jgi:hypothetical protein
MEVDAMVRPRAWLAATAAVALAAILSACCGSKCIKDPPCKPGQTPTAAPAPAPK